METKKIDQEKPNTPGRKPETLKIEGNWEDSIGKAMEKKRPKDGWPKAELPESKT